MGLLDIVVDVNVSRLWSCTGGARSRAALFVRQHQPL